MITINYLGWPNSKFNEERLVTRLSAMGLTQSGDSFAPFTVTMEVALELVQFCMENGFWFVWDGTNLDVCEEKGFYVEY